MNHLILFLNKILRIRRNHLSRFLNKNPPHSPEPPHPIPQQNPPHSPEPPHPIPQQNPPHSPEPPRPIPQQNPPHSPEPPRPAPNSEHDDTTPEVKTGTGNIQDNQKSIADNIQSGVTSGEAPTVGTTSATYKDNVITCEMTVTFGSDATPATRDKVCNLWHTQLTNCSGIHDWDDCTWTQATKRQAGSTEIGITSSKTALSGASGSVISMISIFALSLLLLVVF